MNESELPKLPDGWEYRHNSVDGTVRAINATTDVDVDVDGEVVTVIVPSDKVDYSQGTVPLAVILAVAKANGVL